VLVPGGDGTPLTTLLPAGESWAFYHMEPFGGALGYGSLRGSTRSCIGNAGPNRTPSRGGSRSRGYQSPAAATGVPASAALASPRGIAR
jgi:hypothetical protein